MQKMQTWLKNNRLNILAAVVTGIAALFFFSSVMAVRAQGGGWQNDIIRLHVLAADDSPAQQALKLAVRDGVWMHINELIKSTNNINCARDIIYQNLEQIGQMAEEISGQPAAARLVAWLDFPPMSYGMIFLPQGYYEALQIVIGEGAGQNWWCIMFPPMCLMDITRAVVEDAPEEDANEINLRPRFRIAELWQGFFN